MDGYLSIYKRGGPSFIVAVSPRVVLVVFVHDDNDE